MKTLPSIILIVYIFIVSCQSKQGLKLDFVKIAPMGISDLPRDTLYMLVNPNKVNAAIYKGERNMHQVITDVKTLSAIESFIIRNNHDDSIRKNFNDYGCLAVSGYCKDSLVINYKLDRIEGKVVVNSFINLLTNNNYDVRVIKALKEQCLEPINY